MCAGAALFVVVAYALLTSQLPLSQRAPISDVGLFVAVLAATTSCVLRSRSWTGRRKRAWLIFGGAMACGTLGNASVLLTDLAGQPNASWVNPVFLLGLLLGLVGLCSFPSVLRRGTEAARMLVDGVIIGGAIIVIASATVVTELLSGPKGSLLHQANLLLPPVLDMATVTLAVLLIVRTGVTDRPSLALLSAGVTLYAICDLARLLSTARHTFHYGTGLDVGWMAGSLLIALAGLNPAAARTPGRGESRDASAAAGTILIFGLVGTAAVLSMQDPGQISGSSGELWLVLVFAVAVRQILLIFDNDKLRHSLERRVSERTNELRHATRRSELLLSSVGEGIYGVDSFGSVTFINPAGAIALGCRPEDLIGRQAHATFHGVQQDGQPFPLSSCYVTEAIRDGTVTNAEEDVYLRSGGRTFPVEVTATPMSSDDFVQGAVVVFRDVTQRQEVDRLKSEFVAMVSHELRTPLTSIRGSLGLLAGGALGVLPPTALRMIDLALDSSARLTRLINDILDIERIESGTMPMEISNHRADVLIDTAVAQLQVLAAQVDVQLVVKDPQGLVHADADRVVQTLINLMDNAIKFSPRQSLVEVTSVIRGDVVEFRITDHGRGIPADKLDRIFSRFEQVDSSDAREKGGSGLGLAISRSVIERQGGRIWAESVEGAGSTFRFTLPRSSLDTNISPAELHQLTTADILRVDHHQDPAPASAGST